MKLPVRNAQGEVTGEVELQDEVFAVPPHPAVVHQALVRQLANARQGNAKTKRRAEIAGSGRKLYPQKHTGRARQGMRRAPQRVGSGKAFGPRPRSYRQDMPKKMRRLALKVVLSDKAREGELVVVEGFPLNEASTKEMGRILSNLGATRSALVVTEKPEPAVVLSARNLLGVKTLPAPLLNVADLLQHHHLVMTVPAVRRAEEIWGRRQPLEGVG